MLGKLPAVTSDFGRWLRIRDPRLWDTRAHWLLPLLGLGTAGAALYAGLAPVALESVPRVDTYFLAALGAACALLVFWSYQILRAWRQVPFQQGSAGWLLLPVYMICVALAGLPALTFSIIADSRIAKLVTKDELIADARILAASDFFTHEIATGGRPQISAVIIDYDWEPPASDPLARAKSLPVIAKYSSLNSDDEYSQARQADANMVELAKSLNCSRQPRHYRRTGYFGAYGMVVYLAGMLLHTWHAFSRFRLVLVVVVFGALLALSFLLLDFFYLDAEPFVVALWLGSVVSGIGAATTIFRRRKAHWLLSLSIGLLNATGPLMPWVISYVYKEYLRSGGSYDPHYFNYYVFSGLGGYLLLSPWLQRVFNRLHALAE